MKIALIVEYEGTRYHGFQIQTREPTIQGELERVLMVVTGEEIRISYAGRTDQGVHAKGQVVAFQTNSPLPPKTIARALNHYLSDDIAVRDAFSVDDDFDPRRDALSREYCYYIWNSSTPSPLMRRSSSNPPSCRARLASAVPTPNQPGSSNRIWAGKMSREGRGQASGMEQTRQGLGETRWHRTD